MPTALLSTSDKTGVASFARRLVALGYDVLSTGGTAAALAQAGVAVTPVRDHTGAPEILGGRVKTLHPRIHGGILARPTLDSDRADLDSEGIAPIALVVVNLYPFRETIAREGATLVEAVEQIDIGGPTMLRSAAKNFAQVTVVVDPQDYDTVESRRCASIGPSRCGVAGGQGLRSHGRLRRRHRGLPHLPRGSGGRAHRVSRHPLAAVREGHDLRTARTRTIGRRSTASPGRRFGRAGAWRSRSAPAAKS